ncbi:cell division protein ZapE [Aliiroseovarius sp. 2305UL8-7]|uniref:cell division protein ZapE n=1 Tax=Aliiroseovarius conchicola TaxID=3121637 RepID=UPI00352883DE
MTTLPEIYDALAQKGEIKTDAAQEACLPALDTIRAFLEAAPVRKRGLLGGLFQAKQEDLPKGLYLWGGVGRGKSMLMDLFVDHLNIAEKRRVHFHAFMQEVHERMAQARKAEVDDPLAKVAAQIAADVRLFAFDEMQITDITDAMIVGRLFEKLFEADVIVVTTSNRHPDDLYKDGLNRQLFLPFIALIKEQMTIHELSSPNDYRQDRLAGEQVYFTPAGTEARQAIDLIWSDLTGGKAAPLHLAIKGRDVVLPAFHNGAARAGFHDLCGVMLGPGDYLEIADAVKLLVLEDIPQLGRSNFNEAKRFVILIDALYEAKVRLIVSAAAQPEMLYIEGEGSFEFERTASRLREMQDKDWGAE